MAITLNGTTGITTPDIDTDGLSVDTNAIFVDPATNNVGIGTSSPVAGLHVATSTRSVSTCPPTAGGGGASFFLMGNSDSGGASGPAMIVSANRAIQFGVGNSFSSASGGAFTEHARIDSSGNFMVGCTGLTNDAPNAAGGTFKSTNGNTKIRMLSDNLAAIQFYSPTGGTSSPVGSIHVNTNNVQYNTSSDYRLKENVIPMQNALATVANLNPVTYNWKVDGSVGQGFIAHELQAVVPDCVTGEKDAVDEEGNPQYQGVDTSFLVGVLTAAIQEQQTLIQALTARIEALEQA